jgi:DNA (cytosine-5)-methyltransferase 1
MKKSPSVISLFSGCGGLDLGFHNQGFEVIWANDIVPDFCKTLENNFNCKVVCSDINDVNLEELPKTDLIIGGPPCQSFSLVGKRKSDDERGDLVWSYLKVLKTVKPKIFLFENVLGLRSAKNNEGRPVLEDLRKAFKKAGYEINVHLLNAADYGVPQRRKRVFIIGTSFGIQISAPDPTHSETGMNGLKKWISAEEALSDLPQPSIKDGIPYRTESKSFYQNLLRKHSKSVYYHYPPYASKKDMEIIKSVKPGGNYMDVPDTIATQRILNFKKTGGRTTTYGRLHPKQTPYTINTHFNRPNVGCNIHYKYDRLITIREGLRIQSFPDNFRLHSSNKRNYYMQVGNAVPPLLAEAWAKHLKKYVSIKI